MRLLQVVADAMDGRRLSPGQDGGYGQRVRSRRCYLFFLVLS